ncbi:MAG: sigma 54-interacting transcriptional regulator [Deltaproteobacteria bacterium]|nr:sigma 54-interacting transcriptional regulator [Deltaproteobacteria bacterium]
MRPILERYDVVRELGEGGGGAVYLVRDRFSGGREMALKRIVGSRDEMLVRSLRREFQVMAALRHPSLAQVHDFGEIGPGEDVPPGPFFTREHIEGQPLLAALGEAGALQVARVFCELARALVPLHRSGLVHGDLKPQNVIVSGTQVRLIDFGLTRRQGDRDDRAVGTLSYLPPEVACGAAADLRADVYALGATLYHALAGQPPFVGRSASEVIDQHLHVEPSPPGPARSELAGATFDRLAQVALRCLAKRPEDRYPDVTEIEAALRSAAPDAHAPAAPVVPVLPGALGRKGEFEALDAALSRRLDGQGGEPLHVVRGEPGSGKSTLLREFKWRAQLRGARVIEGAVPEAGGPYGPVADLVRQAVALCPEGSAAREAGSSALRSLETVGGVTDGNQLSEWIATTVVAAAQRSPTCLVVEDLDRADAEVGSLLRYVAHSAGPQDPLLVVVSCSTQNEAVRALGHSPVTELGPFGRAEVSALVKATRGHADESLAEAILSHAGGNPLFTIEVLRVALSGGVASARDLEALRIPARLEDVLLERVRVLPAEDRALVEAASGIGRPCSAELLGAVAGVPETGPCLARLAAAGLVAPGADGDLRLLRAPLAQGALATMPPADRQALHSRIASELASRGVAGPELVHHLVQAGDVDGARRLVPEAAGALRKIGAYRQAADLLEGLSRLCATEPVGRAAAESLADIHLTLGEYDLAAKLLDDLLVDARTDERARALTLLGRVRSGRGAYDAACQALEEALALQTTDAGRAAIHRDLARIHMKRGSYDAAERSALQGLALAGPAHPCRIELGTALGMVMAYRGDTRGAMGAYAEALALSRQVGERRDEANVLQYLAIAHRRAGDPTRAMDHYQQSLAIAEQIGDTASVATCHLNLGAVSFFLGDPAHALDHYQQAGRIARRIGREQTAVMAKNNLANLFCHLGMYERARREAEEAVTEAERLGLKLAAAQGSGLLGEVAAREGRRDDALRSYTDAMQRYRELGQRRELAELRIEVIEVLLDRGMPGDLERAITELGEVGAAVDEDGLDDFRPRLALLKGRARALQGDEDAAGELDRALKLAAAANQRDLEWQIHVAAAELFAERGAEFLARRRSEQALEILEAIASSLPKEFRHSFWQDPRRRAARKKYAEVSGEFAHVPLAAAAGGDDSLAMARTAPVRASGPASAPAGDASPEKLYRLLELNKKINSELDLDRLLEIIMDTVIELTGAERGFLLLADEGGKLQRTTVRDLGGATPSVDHAQFSRSIAEAVFVDGEPVITTSALDDERFNEYLSVHQLRLQSVLCLPIRARGRVLGVLYMENRVRHGRFGERDEHLLALLADQVAIAIENARLIREANERRLALELANRDLEAAKAQIEEHLTRRTAQLEAARSELRRARSELREKFGYRGIVGRCEPMRRLFAVLDRVRETDVPVVIHGESGTGKEMVARAIHYGGPRSKKPFVAINCAAIPETILESELFGHVRGAFTGAERDKRGLFQSADGGTLFLDEIGDMPPKMQLDLLRVLQEKKVRPVGGDKDVEVDVRVLAASNRILRDLIAEGKFREDLYYRLNVVEMVLPPLRDRADDIPLLIDHFLTHIAARFKSEKKGVTRDAVRRLMAYPWPGNVRQLEHALMNAWVLSDGDTLDEGDFSLEPVREPAPTAQAATAREPAGAAPPERERVDRKALEKQRILDALEKTNWNKSKACDVLGMPRRTLYRRLREYEIQ